MSAQRVRRSAAGLFRDRHMATDRRYEVTDPDGRQDVFCSACCLPYYACYDLPADVEPPPRETGTEVA